MKFMTHVLLFLSLTVLSISCGDENQLQSQEPTERIPTRSEVNDLTLKSKLPKIKRTQKDVIVVPWIATTQGNYLTFKTHSYDVTNKSLQVSTLDPNENWVYNVPKYLYMDRVSFNFMPERSDATHDTFVKEVSEKTLLKSRKGPRSYSSYALPYRLEIMLYKNLNGTYTGECDYSLEFQDHNFWGNIKTYTDHAINYACPITKV